MAVGRSTDGEHDSTSGVLAASPFRRAMLLVAAKVYARRCRRADRSRLRQRRVTKWRGRCPASGTQQRQPSRGADGDIAGHRLNALVSGLLLITERPVLQPGRVIRQSDAVGDPWRDGNSESALVDDHTFAPSSETPVRTSIPSSRPACRDALHSSSSAMSAVQRTTLPSPATIWSAISFAKRSRSLSSAPVGADLFQGPWITSPTAVRRRRVRVLPPPERQRPFPISRKGTLNWSYVGSGGGI